MLLLEIVCNNLICLVADNFVQFSFFFFNLNYLRNAIKMFAIQIVELEQNIIPSNETKTIEPTNLITDLLEAHTFNKNMLCDQKP